MQAQSICRYPMARWGSIVVKGKFPTLEEASVKLFNVVLLPEDGLPTRPINGSRPMMWHAMGERVSPCQLFHRKLIEPLMENLARPG